MVLYDGKAKPVVKNAVEYLADDMARRVAKKPAVAYPKGCKVKPVAKRAAVELVNVCELFQVILSALATSALCYLLLHRGSRSGWSPRD